MSDIISYRFKGGNIRFQQYAKDPLPKWATDVRPEPIEPVETFDLAEKVGDLVRDAFYEACETMQTWNGTLGPMSQDELFAAWMESEARKQLLATFPTLANGVRAA